MRVYSGFPGDNGCPRPNHAVAEDGGTTMAKGQKKTEKTNKPKLSPKEKKANKAMKKATKAAK